MKFTDMDENESNEFLKYLKEQTDKAITFLRDEEHIKCAALLGAIGQLLYNNTDEPEEELND